MTVEHQDILDPYRHEPKGASTAVAGAIYVADGAGSGTWTNKNTLAVVPAYGQMYMNGNATATAMASDSTFYKVAGTFTTGVVYGTSFGSNQITVTAAGVYLIQFYGEVTQGGGAPEEYQFAVGVNGTGNVIGSHITTVPDGELSKFYVSTIASLSASAALDPMVLNTTNDAKGCTVTECHMTVLALRNT
jgi:hypothetical protein